MITSKSNELIKHVRLLNQKKYRDEYKEYFVEGIKMVREAILEKQNIKQIIVSKELFDEEIETFKYEIEYVTKEVFESLTDTKTPQGILAVIAINEVPKILSNVIFALDNVQDPGNVGTIIRTFDACGLKDLILSEGSADVYNPKVVRSTMGAIYRVALHTENDFTQKLLELKNQGYKIIITSLNTDKLYYDIDFNEKCVIVIGNESKGVSENVIRIADEKVKIPMIGKTESLNAAVASSIIMYEYVRKH